VESNKINGTQIGLLLTELQASKVDIIWPKFD
jgi:hypothetical protein